MDADRRTPEAPRAEQRGPLSETDRKAITDALRGTRIREFRLELFDGAPARPAGPEAPSTPTASPR